MDAVQEIMGKALDEGRLAYKVLDHNNRSCNGGKMDWTPYLPTPNGPGKWLPVIAETSLCESGYHVTMDPAIWIGNAVYVCQTREHVNIYDPNKSVHNAIRLIKRIMLSDCIDPRVYVRVAYPFLSGANLTRADLTGAYLTRADLSRADLTSANLTRANLTRADLSGAYLTGAYQNGYLGPSK